MKLNNIVCTITNSSKYCPVTSLYKIFNFLKLDDIYLLKQAKFMYQLHQKKFKTALNDCFIKEVTWRMEHSRYFFFLANGAGAMNSYCRESLSPQTGIAALTLTVMQGFEAKKE